MQSSQLEFTLESVIMTKLIMANIFKYPIWSVNLFYSNNNRYVHLLSI